MLRSTGQGTRKTLGDGGRKEHVSFSQLFARSRRVSWAYVGENVDDPFEKGEGNGTGEDEEGEGSAAAGERRARETENDSGEGGEPDEEKPRYEYTGV